MLDCRSTRYSWEPSCMWIIYFWRSTRLCLRFFLKLRRDVLPHFRAPCPPRFDVQSDIILSNRVRVGWHVRSIYPKVVLGFCSTLHLVQLDSSHNLFTFLQLSTQTVDDLCGISSYALLSELGFEESEQSTRGAGRMQRCGYIVKNPVSNKQVYQQSYLSFQKQTINVAYK